MSKTYRIPRRGGSGVAFLGVELKDATILLSSLFLGLVCGTAFEMGNTAFIGFPVGGYFANRVYVDWQAKSTPGAFRTYLFSKGIWGYSAALEKQKTLFVGDSTVINRQSKHWLGQAVEKSRNRRGNGFANEK